MKNPFEKYLVRFTFCLAMTANVLLLTGCALTRPTDPYASVPRFQGTRTVHRMPPSPENSAQSIRIQEPLTIDRAIQIALANNPEIAAGRWDLVAAGYRQQVLQAGRWPTLSAEGGWYRFVDDQRLIPARYNGEPGIFDPDIYRGELVLRMPLFTGGRITREIQSAELLKMAEERRLARSREELVFNVASTFYSMLSQREVIRSLEFSTATMEEHHKQVSDLLAAQKAARVDLLRTEVRLADLRQALVREQNILAVQRRLLINLLGVDDETDRLTLAGTLLSAPQPARSAGEIMPVALGRRSDYLAAQSRLEARARLVDAARAGRWPTLSLLATYGARVAGSGESEDVGSVGLGVSVPLFEGGRTTARVGQERAALAADQERLRKLELQIRREVETAVLDIQSSAQRIDATRQAIEQARESLRIERMKYDLGSGSLTDVLDAQTALLQSETNFARALADYHIATAKLRLVTEEDGV